MFHLKFVTSGIERWLRPVKLWLSHRKIQCVSTCPNGVCGHPKVLATADQTAPSPYRLAIGCGRHPWLHIGITVIGLVGSMSFALLRRSRFDTLTNTDRES